MLCLRHIYDSALDAAPEVIVVDNGSTDDSVERVHSGFPDVIVIEAGRNLGFAAANNRAFVVARGEFALLVNTDAQLEPSCIQHLLALMDHNQRIGMAGPQLLNADGTVQTSYEAVPTLATETLNRSLLKRLFPKRFPGKHRHLTGPISVEALIGAVIMIRRTAFDAVGGFDEGFFFFLEETDLAVRMAAAGWEVVHEPRCRAVHLQGATAKTNEAAARIEFYRSRYRFFEKHYGSTAAGILKAVMVLNLTANVLFLGLASMATLGKARSLVHRWRVRGSLWMWHLGGCDVSAGLPRS
jgi:GT2 family glycosyltransferase